MVSVSVPTPHVPTANGLRPVNLKTDLAPLADLIEMAFADSMDNSGRAALREMRALSNFGAGLSMLSGANDMLHGIGLGYVWVEDGRLVGNVSIYPASLPPGMPRAHIIANVAVHPDFRGRGIARKMMETSLTAIRARGGGDVLLQVEQENIIARTLYDTFGFREEGVFQHWRRAGHVRTPPPPQPALAYITRRRRYEWNAEMSLASRVRPDVQGGVGWLRPIARSLFQPTLWQRLGSLFNLRSLERLAIRAADETALHAALWIESAVAASSVQLTLMVDDEYRGVYDEALINMAARRFTGSTITIEHPYDDLVTNAILSRYHFNRTRALVHMRWRAA